MIIRHYIKCSTCSAKHTLRIQVGHSNYQQHEFSCAKCEENIVVGMNCFPETASVEVKHLENCSPSDEEGAIIYLSSGFPARESDRNADLAFPAMEHMETFRKSLLRRGVDFENLLSAQEIIENPSVIRSPDDNWPHIKKSWSLDMKGRTSLASQQLQKYARASFEGPYDLADVQFDFFGALLMPGRYGLFQSAAEAMQEAAKMFRPEFLRFKTHYLSEWQTDHMARYFDIFSQYFKRYSDYSQTLMFSQNDIDLPPDFSATSHAFSDTKQFYGNAFEALTSNISVLACVNNILNGRPFDQFSSMDLKKYLTLNKANRANPFSEEARLSGMTSCLDSTLRNASHHGHIKLVNGRNVEYRSGGTGALKSMSYLAYLQKCNEIMLACCATIQLELALAF